MADLLTAPPRLPHLPRYFRAIDLRPAKIIRKGEAQDREQLAQVDVFQRAYLLRKSPRVARGVADPELDALRWMIEEFRVHLFAQELGGAKGVSVKRLDEQFRKVRA